MSFNLWARQKINYKLLHDKAIVNCQAHRAWTHSVGRVKESLPEKLIIEAVYLLSLYLSLSVQ